MKRAKAEQVAATIRRYWAERGATVNVWVLSEMQALAPRSQLGEPDQFTVRSDLLNGLPRRMTAETAAELLTPDWQRGIREAAE